MKFLTNYVPQGGEMLGYVAVEENGELKLQKLSFNGNEAAPDGATEAMLEVGMFPTGMNEPAYAGSGGGGGGGSAMKFYQCTAVDTVNKTWSGKELILQDGVYVVSDTETTGLVYGTSFVPIIGNVYSEDALLYINDFWQWDVAIPTDTAFNIPLDQTSLVSGRILPYPNFGDTWQISNSSVVQHQYNAGGVTCMYINPGSSMYIETWSSLCAADAESANATTGCSARYGEGNPWTYSFWFYPDANASNGEGGLFAAGYYYNNGYHRQLLLTYKDADGSFRLRTTSNASMSSEWSGYAEKAKWHHVCVTAESDAKTFKLYVDGNYVTSLVHPSQTIPSVSYMDSPQIYIGGIWNNGCDYPAAGGYAKLKWFNRVLNTGEITALASDINTTA